MEARYLLRSDNYYAFGIVDSTKNFSTFYGNGSWHEWNANTPSYSIDSPNVLAVLSNGTNATPYFNGTALNTKPSNMGNSVSAGVSIGKRPNNTGYWDGLVGEVIVFNSTLSNFDRQKVEAYLAYKWGLTDQMPSGHPGKISGWSVGRNISESNEISVNIGGVGGSKTATHSTALSTDNQWHHIVSTYDGGTRKIYLDGTEVSSASASGAVASTAASSFLVHPT